LAIKLPRHRGKISVTLCNAKCKPIESEYAFDSKPRTIFQIIIQDWRPKCIQNASKLLNMRTWNKRACLQEGSIFRIVLDTNILLGAFFVANEKSEATGQKILGKAQEKI